VTPPEVVVITIITTTTITGTNLQTQINKTVWRKNFPPKFCFE
jgi:hypothetical protein